MRGRAGFAKYPSKEAGFKAIVDLIDTYAKRKATIESFIYSYAPPFENPTEAYIADVVKWTGYKRTDYLIFLDEWKLAEAIAKRDSSTIIKK